MVKKVNKETIEQEAGQIEDSGIEEFKFSLDQFVVTPFKETGIIMMLCIDHAGILYLVKTQMAGEQYYREHQLRIPGQQ